MDQNWSLKSIHRLIVRSATYRQSSRVRPDGQAVDPDNRLLWRQARLRLDAELIRDAALTGSGLLTRVIGGPSVFPPQPDGVMTPRPTASDSGTRSCCAWAARRRSGNSRRWKPSWPRNAQSPRPAGTRPTPRYPPPG